MWLRELLLENWMLYIAFFKDNNNNNNNTEDEGKGWITRPAVGHVHKAPSNTA
jgi:hypothetical protein